MAFVSLTRLKLRSVRFFLSFAWHSWRSVRQSKSTPGFISGQLGRDADGAYWTVTVWTDAASMRNFRNKGSHMAVMPKLMHWCSEASVAHWEQSEESGPTAEEALHKMSEIGRPSKVYHASPAHLTGNTTGDHPPVFAYPFQA